MKITRTRLRQIIKEEVSRAIHENPLSPGDAVSLANLFKPVPGEIKTPMPLTADAQTRLERVVDSMLTRPPVSEWMNDPTMPSWTILDDFMDLHSEDLKTVYERMPAAEDAIEAYLKLKLQERARNPPQKSQPSRPPRDIRDIPAIGADLVG